MKWWIAVQSVQVKQNPEWSLLLLNYNNWKLFSRFTFLFLFTFSFSLESRPFHLRTDFEIILSDIEVQACGCLMNDRWNDSETLFFHYFGHLTMSFKFITIFSRKREIKQKFQHKAAETARTHFVFCRKESRWAPQ